MLVRVTGVEVLDRYRLRLTFNDGVVGIVDLAQELWGEMFEPLRDEKLFCQARLDQELGTVVWPNGATSTPRAFAPARKNCGRRADDIVRLKHARTVAPGCAARTSAEEAEPVPLAPTQSPRQAALLYSWSRPPRRSRRSTGPVSTRTSGVGSQEGRLWPSPWCGRA